MDAEDKHCFGADFDDRAVFVGVDSVELFTG
jgi:hypothetical protein